MHQNSKVKGSVNNFLYSKNVEPGIYFGYSKQNYPMSNLIILRSIFLLFVVTALFSCSRNSYPKRYPQKTVIITDGRVDGLPPGQAKKIYGSKSAKPFAPGQRKKSHGTVVVIR